MKLESIVIVGVGLIGGSIGLAARKRRAVRHVAGIGRHAGRLRRAKALGAVDVGTTSMERGIARAELVIVCTPVATIADRVLEAARYCRQGTLITDAGSTKRGIVDRLERELPAVAEEVAFVGSHPVAGSEQSGVEHARADLFEGRLVVVTPTRRSREADVERVEAFWRSLGARTVRRSAASHDKALADSSHLPHLVASLLAAATPPECLPFAGSGWEDTTRIAAGDSQLWQQILSQNRQNVLTSLDRFVAKLMTMRDALAADDGPKIKRILEAGRRNRESVGS